jgi:hypothetical protein
MRAFKLTKSLMALLAAALPSMAAQPVAISFQNGVNGYQGTFDRRIGPGSGTNPEIDGIAVSGNTAYYIDGGASTLNDGGYTQGLIRFDGIVEALPAGAKIVEAKLTVLTKTHSNAQSGNNFNIYRLSRAFDSNSSALAGGDFGTNGLEGDVDMLIGSFEGMLTGGTQVSADVTRAVQSWVNGSPNLGLGIRADRGTDGWSFHTTGAGNIADRPKLEISYFTVEDDAEVHEFQQGLNGYTDSMQVIYNAPIPVAPDPPVYTTIIGSTVQEAFLDGVNPPSTEPDIPGMLRFGGVETELEGRKVVSAILRIVTGFSSGAADSPGPFTVHPMLVPFDESSQYGEFAGDSGAMLTAGQIGPAVAVFTGMQDTEVVDVDVSEVVRNWATGTANHGFYIGSGTPNGWQIFTTGASEVGFRPLLRVISTPLPPIAITSPAASSRNVLGTPMVFQADAAVTPPATVAQVEFFVNGVSVGTDSTAPYSFSYPAASLGNFVLTAVLTDSEANTITSEPVTFSVIPAAGSGGLYFDGLADHVALGDTFELKLATFTIETWFRRETPGIATTTGTGGVVAIPLVAKGRNQAENSTLDTNWFLGIRESDGVLCADFEGAGGANVPVAGITPVAYGEWQHAAATFNGTEWRLYLNGNLEAVRNAGGLTPRFDSIQHASIATAMNSTGLGEGAFGGFMDEVRIWNTARTQAQLRQSIHFEVPSSNGLVARWGMTEGTGNTITSSAFAPTVGTFSGAPVWTNGAAFSNNILPDIAFVSPSSGESFLKTDTITVTVIANDPDGSITEVAYFDNGVLIGTSTVSPFSFNYANPPVGTRRLVAVAKDNNGNTSRTNDILTLYITFDSPTVPGYSAGLVDGGDEDLYSGIPAADPAGWNIAATSPSPRGFTDPGTIPGDLDVRVNGSAVPFNSGVLLTTNVALNDNFASIDNFALPYESSGFYRVSNMDNNGPGEVEPLVSPESSSFALAWFPYADGWVGANIAADGSVVGGSSSLPPTVSITNSAVGTYRIEGLPSSGNLLSMAIGAGDDNSTAVALSGDAWIVTVGDNNQNLENGGFCFVYVPTAANRVLSGTIGNLGEVTALNGELALVGASCVLGPQGYEITFGNGSVINPSNTALFVTPDPTLGIGADNIYSYSANGNSFVVFSHDLPGLPTVHQNGGFRFLATPLNPVAPVTGEVSLVVSDSQAAEDGSDQTLAFTVTRSGSINSELTVNYTVGGSATPGDDFISLPGLVVIPSGSASAQVSVTVLPDNMLEQTETVTLSLAAGVGYTLSQYASGTGMIMDAGSNLPTTTVQFQQGVNGYSGQFQKRIGYAISSGTYTAQLGSSVASYGVDGGDPDINDMIRFDNIIGNSPGQVPPGAKVLKAELVLTTAVVSDAQSPGPFMVDRLTSPVNGNTTYDEISAGSGFEGVRGISTGLPVAGFPPLAQGEAGAADVTSIVREWASGTPNHGFAILTGGTSDGWNYCTVGNANVALRPRLSVTYINQPSREYTFTADRSARINSQPGSNTLDGSSLNAEFIDALTNNSQEALIRFAVAFDDMAEAAIPLDEEIVKAELLVTTANPFFGNGTQSTGPVLVHQMLEDWTTSTSYGLHGTKIGVHVAPPVAAMTGLGQGSTTWIDVTSMVRSWRAGAPNHGVSLKPGTGDDWMLFWPGTPFGDVAAPRLRITTAGGSIPNDPPFAMWAAANGAAGITTDSDDDGDGITALVEYALGLSPTASDTLPGLVRNGGNLSLSFTKGLEARVDPRISYKILGSDDLTDWVEEVTAVNAVDSISVQKPVGQGTWFFRLEVIYTP